MSFKIQEYKPGPLLAPFVEFFWEGDFNTNMDKRFARRVAPNGYVELIIHLSDWHCDLIYDNIWRQSPDYTIIGLYTKPYEVRFRKLVHVFGIRFKPEGIYNLFGIPASVFSERYEDMEQVLGIAFREYCARLRESKSGHLKLKLTRDYLMDRLERHNPDLNYINRAAELIRRNGGLAKIDQLPEKVYISLRQLQREFKEKIGLTPKQYLRIARLNDVHRRLEEGQKVEFTRVAYECGYADQAHFIRDFKAIMGVKPTLFFENRHTFIVNAQTSEKSAS